jgi:hypothetical protein
MEQQIEEKKVQFGGGGLPLTRRTRIRVIRMDMEFEKTCWRGMVIEHPAGWELAVASGVKEARRCTFADRFYHRLDVTWQEIDFVPQLSLLLDKHRKTAQKQSVKCQDVTGLPAGWEGVVQDTQGGVVVRAARFFAKEKVLAEAALVWPERRDRQLEAAVLERLRPGEKGKEQLWQAMGLSVTIGAEYELQDAKAPVGKTEWEFAAGAGKGKEEALVTVTRLAMPKYWLDGPLRDWLAEQVPATAGQVRQDAVRFNDHRAEQVLSAERIGLIASWRGLRHYRLDVAWLCPTEQRVYHVTCRQRRRDAEVTMPASLRIRCCRAGTGAQG